MILYFVRNYLRSLGKQKIFCIGLNKTGTTSLEKAMRDMGYIVGHQVTAERYVTKGWGVRDFRKLKWYCRTAVFFQDVPFSKPYTYIILDYLFPSSKFILTVRDTPEQWYDSLTKFHAKLWGKDGRIPTKEDLLDATYGYKGAPWVANRMTFTTPEDDPYRKEILLDYYSNHNKHVMEYFRHRPEDLLILNVAESDAYRKLGAFLGKEPASADFPWENHT
jgi:hypothetical protein